MASRFSPGVVYENLNFQHLFSLHYLDRLVVTQLLISKEAVQNSLLLRFGLRKTKMAADGSLQLVFINVTALHHQFISNHNGRRLWKSQFGVFFGAVFLVGLRCGFYFQFVLFPQPGDNFSEMSSGLAAGLV